MRKLTAVVLVVLLIGILLLISVSSAAALFQNDQPETNVGDFIATPTPRPAPQVMPTATAGASHSVPAATPVPTSQWTVSSQTTMDDEYQAQVVSGITLSIKNRSSGKGSTIATISEGDIVTILNVSQSGNVEIARVRYHNRTGWVLFSQNGEEYFEPVDD